MDAEGACLKPKQQYYDELNIEGADQPSPTLATANGTDGLDWLLPVEL